MSAFVLGNGKSRLLVDLELLKTVGTVYGCNAIYRDFLPHYLISVDYKMAVELIEEGIPNKTEVWTNPHSRLLPSSNINMFRPSLGWSSGPTALNLAAEHGHSEIYILGFDYQGIENNTKFNNVYAGTKNYKKENDSPTFYGNWLSQTEIVFRKFPDIKFYRVVSENTWRPAWNLSNVEHISVSTFNEKIKN